MGQKPKTMSVRLDIGEPAPIDGLCPVCFLPSLFEVPLFVLSAAGVSRLTSVTICQGCGH